MQKGNAEKGWVNKFSPLKTHQRHEVTHGVRYVTTIYGNGTALAQFNSVALSVGSQYCYHFSLEQIMPSVAAWAPVCCQDKLK